jgi:hypothetical protein
MSTQYKKDITGLVVIDPYNDFIPKAASSGTGLSP